MSEDVAQLLHNLFLGVGARNGKFFDEEITRGVEHFSTERKLFVALQHEKSLSTLAISRMDPVLIFSVYSR